MEVIAPTDVFDQEQAIEDLALKPKPSNRRRTIVFRVLAALCAVWALLVLITETTLIFDKKKTILYYWADSTPR